ncbi:MAG: alpha/beta hydrolase [Acidobacteriia bacterium]|nr:alpha/beta hydrolase [Terriglobia bacterium]
MKLLLLSVALASGLLAQAPFQVKVTGHGQPLILIPGLSSSGETWDTTVARYQDRFECHVLTVAGFAGVPRVPAPMLDRVRDGLADYIRKNHLAKPVIIGHSLGGYEALALAAKYPDLPGKLVIVDAYPFFAGIASPDATPAQVNEMVAGMRQYYGGQDQDAYDRFTKSGVATRIMVTRDSDLDRLIAWGLASDRTAVADAMCELFSADLRNDLARIKSPTLVLGSWIGYKQYTNRKNTEANLHRQYAQLDGVEIQITDTARHFIMWDDPEWMFGHLDRFLGLAQPVPAR